MSGAGEATLRALRVHREGDGQRARIEALEAGDLDGGDVALRVAWSAVNYKDALAGTGRGPILRGFPRVPGIDAAGVVESSADPRFRPGDAVVVSGPGFGVDHDGGYATRAAVPGDWLVPLPRGLDLRGAMVLGTAGMTAALALERMERNGQRPELGPVLVTGATGGVGSFAVDLLARRGYAVAAVTGKPEAADYLRALGAGEVLPREAVAGTGRPLEHGRWGGVVDNVGGEMLARLLASVRPHGNVAAIGLAAGSDLHTTVMPFILRGVSLLGIDSVGISGALRRRLWQRLGDDLRPRHLEAVVAGEIPLEGLPEAFEEVLAGRHRGRTLVRLTGDAGEAPAP